MRGRPGNRPVVGVAACIKKVMGDEGMAFHAVPDPYVAAVAAVGAVPLLVPALGGSLDLDTLFSAIDGLVLTGSISNLHPDLYGGVCRPCPPYDPRRDATALALIRHAIELDVPLLAICRGIQELNVALGGTLHPRVHEVEGRFDHRSDYTAAIDQQFSPAHRVRLTGGGWFRGLAQDDEIMVNSLHGQGIDQLAPGLVVEAVAPDGQIEAIRVEGKRFAVGVQWHPEWDFAQNPFSHRLFDAFAAAVEAYRTASPA